MKFTTFFTQIMFLNTMGALGIRHVINIMGYVRDIPDSAGRFFGISDKSCKICFSEFYQIMPCIMFADN